MNKLISFSGSSDEFKDFLALHFPEIKSRDLDNYLYGFEALANIFCADDDVFEIDVIDDENENPDSMNLYIPSIQYNINMRTAGFHLVLNVIKAFLTSAEPCAAGFGTMIDMFVNSVRKVDETNGEACILREMVLPNVHPVYNDLLPPKDGLCFNNHLKCKYNNSGCCTISRKDVSDCFELLEKKNIVRKMSDGYQYISISG